MKNQGINYVMLHTIGDPLANVRLSEQFYQDFFDNF